MRVSRRLYITFSLTSMYPMLAPATHAITTKINSFPWWVSVSHWACPPWPGLISPWISSRALLTCMTRRSY
ncbi:hypothetical protein E2562_018643 [Oryza meyeriana var. granulata]|uniref:Uncharacterized protein n=1 Tax=Oryza meyeriana var. granulata TaxID=110450 RepID=A0A6G1BY34_9ORYZ|nr:hypothetical protein E2562_018643 [Oryza meyeriana var. granulata]